MLHSNQHHGPDIGREPHFSVHPAPALKHVTRAMHNSLALESVPFAYQRIDDIYLDRRVGLDVLNRLRRPYVGEHQMIDV
jgi:hypothetical protein